MRLKVRIDGVWYRVVDGELHEVSSPAGGGRPQLQFPPAISKDPCKRDPSTQRANSTDQSSEADNTISHCIAQEGLPQKSGKKIRESSTRHSWTQAATHTSPAQCLDPRSLCRGRDMAAPGYREESVGGCGIDDLCSFVRGRAAQVERSPMEYDDYAEYGYGSDESCMSTATSARKGLVIRIKLPEMACQRGA